MITNNEEISVDFTKDDIQQTRRRVTAGEHFFTVIDVYSSKININTPSVAFLLEDETGARLLHNCSILSGQRWKLVNTLTAIDGEEKQEGEFKIVKNNYIGKTFRAIVKHTTKKENSEDYYVDIDRFLINKI